MVRQRSTTVTVTGADGASYSDGAARVVDHDVIQAVRPLPAGTYRVAWKTAAADGDPEQGQFGFTMAAPPSPTPATSEPSPTPTTQPGAATTAPSRTATANTANTGWLWPVIAAAVVLAALAAAAVVWRRRRTG
jgi:hypothetical protein